MNYCINDKDKYKVIRKYANELFEDEKFEDSYIKMCLKILFPEIIANSDDELINATEGLGSNDGGIDSFIIDDKNKYMYICQFKTSENYNPTTISPDALNTFFALEENVLNYIEHKNSKVREIAEIIKTNKDYNLQFYFITSYNLPNNFDFLDNQKEKLEDGKFKILTLDDIYDKYIEYETSLSCSDIESCTITFIPQNTHSTEIPLYEFTPEKIGKKQTSIGIVNGLSLVKLYEKERKKLFDRNVRYFLGEKGINKQIITTAKDEPNRFYYFNNGITITCSEFNKKGLSLILKSPQIINGAQTVSSLYEAYKDLKYKHDESYSENHFKKIHIMTRIIQTTKGDEIFSRSVTKYNNTQNKIEDSDFYANDSIQKHIHSKMLSYNIFYENKRNEFEMLSTTEKKKYRLIKLKDLTTIYNSFKNEETSTGTKKKNLFKPENFEKIFNEDSKRESNIKSMIFAYNLYEIIKDLTKQINNLGTDKNFKNKSQYSLKLESIFSPQLIEVLKKDFNTLGDDKKYVEEIEPIKHAFVIIAIVGFIINKANIDIPKYFEDTYFYEHIQKKWLREIGKIVMSNYKTVNKSFENSIYYYKSPELMKHFKEYVRDKEMDNVPLGQIFEMI